MANTLNYSFDLPYPTKSIIKVIGVGGGGSNAVNYMYNRGIKDVEFIVCNTDAQALNLSPVPTKLQIGAALTEGLGAGANPEKGREAALESKTEIRNILADNTKMLFITAGMGGGTGTGAAPIIAEVAKELGILTVSIVTSPFMFEGSRKAKQAEIGIDALKKNCDTLIVISNERLREIYGNLKMTEAFAQADNILATAAKSIAEIITVDGYVNVDFEDVKTVMRNSGAAVIGSAKTEGENRAIRAAQEALTSPLLNNRSIKGAKKILLSVMSSDKSELQLDEFAGITDFIKEEVGSDAEVIFGNGIDPALGDSIRVTIVATGFDLGNQFVTPSKKDETQPEKEEDRSIIFDVNSKSDSTLTEKIEEEVKKQDTKVVFNLEDPVEESYEPENKEKDLDLEKELEAKREWLAKQADERIQKLKQMSKNIDTEGLKEKLEIPAYLRRTDKNDNPPSE